MREEPAVKLKVTGGTLAAAGLFWKPCYRGENFPDSAEQPNLTGYPLAYSQVVLVVSVLVFEV